MAQELYEWDNEDIQIKIVPAEGDQFEVDNFLSFRFSNGKRISHIKHIGKGVTGYNRVFGEPSWELSYNSTAKAHRQFLELKNGRKYFNIIFNSSSYNCTAYNCICSDANPGTTSEDSPIITVSGLALNIEDSYVEAVKPGAP